MDRRDAEALLDRELDESKNRERVAPPRSHRNLYSLSVILIVAAVGGVLAYLATTLMLELGVRPMLCFVTAGALIAIVAWGTTGVSRVRTSATDRKVDIAMCLIAIGVLFAVARWAGAWAMFDRFGIDTSRGIGGVPRFHEVMIWSAIWACACVALASLLRLGLRR